MGQEKRGSAGVLCWQILTLLGPLGAGINRGIGVAVTRDLFPWPIPIPCSLISGGLSSPCDEASPTRVAGSLG